VIIQLSTFDSSDVVRLANFSQNFVNYSSLQSTDQTVTIEQLKVPESAVTVQVIKLLHEVISRVKWVI